MFHESSLVVPACKLKLRGAIHNFFYQGFLSQTMATQRKAGEVRRPFFIPVYHFHPLTNIQTFIYNFACEMTISNFKSHRLYLPVCYSIDWPPYRVTIWLINAALVFICLHDDLILASLLQQFETEIRWIWARIDWHPYITNEPTNQVC